MLFGGRTAISRQGCGSTNQRVLLPWQQNDKATLKIRGGKEEQARKGSQRHLSRYLEGNRAGGSGPRARELVLLHAPPWKVWMSLSRNTPSPDSVSSPMYAVRHFSPLLHLRPLALEGRTWRRFLHTSHREPRYLFQKGWEERYGRSAAANCRLL